MRRCVEPELLDQLAPDHHEALGSRRDLQNLNALMGHACILAQSLASNEPTYTRLPIVELGAGDGTLLLRVARRFGWSAITRQALLVDRHPLVSSQTVNSFRQLNWQVKLVCADVFDWLEELNCSTAYVLVANLFLHHFDEEKLATLLRFASKQAVLVVALEPRRAAWPLLLSKLVCLVGCNRVTQHDAPASVRAGFKGSELSRLWPADPSWTLQEGKSGWFSHLFLARKREAGPNGKQLRN